MKALVTGGGGFLGAAIVRGLLARGSSVRSFSRQSYPALDARGVEQVQGDIADTVAVTLRRAGATSCFMLQPSLASGVTMPGITTPMWLAPAALSQLAALPVCNA